MIYHIPAVYKSDPPQYHSSSLLSQAMVIADSNSLGMLTSLAAVRQVVWSGRLSTCGEQKLMVSFVFRFQRNRQTRRYKRTLYTCSQTHLYQVMHHMHQFTHRKGTCETFHFHFDKLLICYTLLKLTFSSTVFQRAIFDFFNSFINDIKNLTEIPKMVDGLTTSSLCVETWKTRTLKIEKPFVFCHQHLQRPSSCILLLSPQTVTSLTSCHPHRQTSAPTFLHRWCPQRSKVWKTIRVTCESNIGYFPKLQLTKKPELQEKS